MTGFLVRNYYIEKNKVNNQPVIVNPEEQVKGRKEEIVKLEKYQVPVLMYHYVRTTDEPEDSVGYKLSVSPDKFDEQMKWLTDNGFKTVDFSYFEEPVKLDYKPIIITFDDGYRDAYTDAYRILRKYNLTATFYIITDVVGYPYYMTWDMIKEMSNSKMKFGSHSLSHPDLRNVSDADLDSQLRYSKDKLEKELNIKIDNFCYPSGKYDEKTISKLKELGYRNAVTTKTGIANETSNIYEIPRLRIQNNTNIGSILSGL